MANNYRIKYKTGDFELEVESTDKAFVESKLKELIQDGQEPAIADSKKATPKRKAVTRQAKKEPEEGNSDSVDIMGIVNEINDADNHPIIEKNILKKANQLNRILLVFYFAHKVHKDTGITTGDIEAVTHQLGIRIKKSNAGGCIKTNSKYFAAENVRRKGAVVKYKINRKGIEEFENLIVS